MFTRHKHGLQTMSALWLLPVVPACVAANTAGVLASQMDDAAQALTVFYIGGCRGQTGVGQITGVLAGAFAVNTAAVLASKTGDAAQALTVFYIGGCRVAGVNGLG
jgi:tellurite resistance protein TehA-like permease